jgi:hypothetical protein
MHSPHIWKLFFLLSQHLSVHPWGVNEGLNNLPRGQSSLLGAKFTPRGKLHPWRPNYVVLNWPLHNWIKIFQSWVHFLVHYSTLACSAGRFSEKFRPKNWFWRLSTVSPFEFVPTYIGKRFHRSKLSSKCKAFRINETKTRKKENK